MPRKRHTTRHWYAKCHIGRVSLYNEIREDRPSTGITEENVIIVGLLFKENRRITYENFQGYFPIGMRQSQKI